MKWRGGGTYLAVQCRLLQHDTTLRATTAASEQRAEPSVLRQTLGGLRQHAPISVPIRSEMVEPIQKTLDCVVNNDDFYAK